MDYQLNGSTATKGVEGEKVASGDRHSPLLHMWCRFCGQTLLINDMTCATCFHQMTEQASDAFMKNYQTQFDEFSRTMSDQVTPAFQKMSDHLTDLARRTMPAPDSPLSPYQATQELTLDELMTEVQKLREDSLSDTTLRALTGSLRGPSPDAVFYDDLP